MSAIASCPGKEKLSEYLLGVLEEADARQVEEHVSDCQSCEDTICQLDEVTDTVIESLRAQNAVTSRQQQLAEPIASAIDRARGIRPLDDTASPAAATGSVEVGVVLGQYQIMEQIGRGGMSTVYRAEHIKLQRPVAIKIVPGGQIQHPEIIARFNREMRAIGKLDHPNLVQAFDAGETANNEYLYLVMELVEGVDAGKLLATKKTLPVEEACEIVRQTCEGLKYIHGQGQIHRDIKPSNLMITPQGTVKILDLGLALLADVEHDKLTTAGQLMGTFDYMSPEQASASHQVSEAADVYSLGCTLYALLTGSPPFSSGAYAHPAQKIVAHSTVKPKSVADHRSDVPDSLVELVGRMLAKRPEDRPTLDAVIKVVELEGGVKTSDSEPTTLAASGAGKSSGRSGAVWGIAAVLLIGLGLLGSGGLYQIIVTIRNEQGEKERLPLKLGEGVIITNNGDGSPDVRKFSTGKVAPSSNRLVANALVVSPAQLDGVDSWTVETVAHRGNIYHAEFRPDGQQLATIGQDQTVRIWDTESGRLLKAFPLPKRSNHAISQLAWSGDGRYLAATPGSVYVWDVQSGELVLEAPDLVALNPGWLADPQRLVVCSRANHFAIWDVATGKKWDEFEPDFAPAIGEGTPTSCSPSGSLVAAIYNVVGTTADPGGAAIEIWDVERHQRLWATALPDVLVHYGSYTDVVWAADGSALALAPGDGSLHVWNAVNGQLRWKLDPGSVTAPLAWSADDSSITDLIGTIDAKTGERNGTRPSPIKRGQRPLALSPDGEILAINESGGEYESTLDLMKLSEERRTHRLQIGVPSYVRHVGWISDNEFAHISHVFSVRTGKDLGLAEASPITSFGGNGGRSWYPCYSPDGERYAIKGRNQVLINSINGEHAQAKLSVPDDNPIAQWSPDGSRILTMGEEARVWDTTNGKLLFSASGAPYHHQFLSLDGNRVIVGSTVFDISNIEEPIETSLPIQGIVELTSDRDLVRIWPTKDHWLEVDLTTGVVTKRGKGSLHGYYRAVYGLYSPGGSYLAFEHYSPGSVQFFDMADNSLLGSIVNLPGDSYLSVSPEGHVRSDMVRYERQIVYLVKRGDVYETYQPEEFANEFDWTNKPDRVRFGNR